LLQSEVEFLERLHDLELNEWGEHGKHGNAGKKKSVILMMFSFTLKNDGKNLPRSARNANSQTT